MQCHDARILLCFGHKPAELSADDAAALGRHLQDCASCGAAAERERRLDSAITRAMHAVTVPEGAQRRLLTELRRRTLVRRRWLSAAAAMAAALLVAVALGGYLWINRPVPLNLDEVGRDLYARQVRGENAATVAAAVTNWFAARDVVMVIPTQLRSRDSRSYDLDYRNLHMIGVADLQGVRVPHLLFHSHGELLHIYVLSDQQFDIAALTNTPPKPFYSGSMTVELLSGGAPNFRYLVAFTGNNLQPFCKPQPGSARAAELNQVASDS